MVRDELTRRVLTLIVADNLRTDKVEETLRQAVASRGQLPKRVVCHADRGCLFTSAQLADVALELEIARSMGSTRVCWDNAQAESFGSTF